MKRLLLATALLLAACGGTPTQQQVATTEQVTTTVATTQSTTTVSLDEYTTVPAQPATPEEYAAYYGGEAKHYQTVFDLPDCEALSDASRGYYKRLDELDDWNTPEGQLVLGLTNAVAQQEETFDCY